MLAMVGSESQAHLTGTSTQEAIVEEVKVLSIGGKRYLLTEI